MWMARARAAPAIRDLDFAGARVEGLEHIDEIAREYEPLIGLPQGELMTYLRDNICFNFDDDMQKGQELFFKLAYKHGIISNATSLKTIDE